jgi:hypothetical protein
VISGLFPQFVAHETSRVRLPREDAEELRCAEGWVLVSVFKCQGAVGGCVASLVLASLRYALCVHFVCVSFRVVRFALLRAPDELDSCGWVRKPLHVEFAAFLIWLVYIWLSAAQR